MPLYLTRCEGLGLACPDWGKPLAGWEQWLLSVLRYVVRPVTACVYICSLCLMWFSMTKVPFLGQGQLRPQRQNFQCQLSNINQFEYCIPIKLSNLKTIFSNIPGFTSPNTLRALRKKISMKFSIILNVKEH